MEVYQNKVPNHIAIMMDGNGRWAVARNRPRKFGHIEGGNTLKEIMKATDELGIKYLTVFALSTENWKRPKEEVDNLIGLLTKYLNNDLKYALKNNIRIRILGDITKMSTELQASIENAQNETRECSGLNFQIAINYGGRDDMVRAFKKIYNEIETNKLVVNDVNEDTISSYLDTFELPEPDLFIRTGGEQRLSNFLLWQFSYTEFIFTDTFWPDFKKNEFEKIVQTFCKRERRFGGVNQ